MVDRVKSPLWRIGDGGGGEAGEGVAKAREGVREAECMCGRRGGEAGDWKGCAWKLLARDREWNVAGSEGMKILEEKKEGTDGGKMKI